MNKTKLNKINVVSNNEVSNDYQHYIALDWSMTVMAIARLKSGWKAPKVIERPSDVSELKLLLLHLPGKKILTRVSSKSKPIVLSKFNTINNK